MIKLAAFLIALVVSTAIVVGILFALQAFIGLGLMIFERVMSRRKIKARLPSRTLERLQSFHRPRPAWGKDRERRVPEVAQ